MKKRTYLFIAMAFILVFPGVGVFSHINSSTVYAEDSDDVKSILFGSEGIASFMIDSNGTSDDGHIWYGNKATMVRPTSYYSTEWMDVGTPYWRVLDAGKDLAGNSGHMLLLSEYVWNSSRIGNYGYGTSATSYQDSAFRNQVLRMYTSGLFSDKEKSAMIVAEKNEAAASVYGTAWSENSVTLSDYLFILSAKEAKEYISEKNSPNLNWNTTNTDPELIAYMGSSATTNALCANDSTENLASWWLRSFRSSYVGVCGSNGKVATTATSSMSGLRPAFNLDLDKITLASPACRGKECGLTGSYAMKAVKNNETNDWKLTLKDTEDHGDFAISSVSKNKTRNTITFIYSGATIGAGEYLSAVIVNSDGEVTYYGKIMDLSSGNEAGTAMIDISSCDTSETDTLYIFNEKCNADYLTDFSSPMQSAGALFSHEIVHSHLMEKTDAVAPTCTKDGNVEYWTCTLCDKIYKDEDGVSESDAEDVIDPATGHSLTKIDAIPATCTDKGNIDYWTCSTCGSIFSDAEGVTVINTNQTITNATGHSWGTWEYLDADTHHRTCLNNPIHEEISRHDWAAYYMTDKEATCTQEGSESIHCTVCLASKPGTAQVIPITDHNYGDWVVTEAATCTKDGSREKVCEGCGDKITETIDALGHDWNEEMTIDVPATCTTDGSKSYHCSRCSETKDVTVIPATGHEFGDWETINPSTCEGEGLKKHTCGKCGYSETEGMNPNGHDWEDSFTIDVPATCTTDGSQSYHCKNCEATIDSEVIPSPGHDWEVSPTVDVPATCTEEGSQSIHCSVCGEKTAAEAIPVIGHDWKTPTYRWSTDYKSVTATRVCKNDATHKETVTVNTTSKVTKAATYTAKGQTTYTAAFSNEAFSTQTKTVTNIAQLPKKANSITVKVKKPTVKYAKLKKKAQTILAKNAFVVSKAQGKVTYKKISGNKKITINSAGKITLKKGLKKKTYKVKVKVTAAGTTAYKAGAKTVTLSIKVK